MPDHPWDEVVRQSNEGTALLVDTPYGRCISFVKDPVPIDQRTPLTFELLDEIADEYQANVHLWPQNQPVPDDPSHEVA